MSWNSSQPVWNFETGFFQFTVYIEPYLTATKENHSIIRKYLEKLYSFKMKNLEEMGKFLDSSKLSTLNQITAQYP